MTLAGLFVDDSAVAADLTGLATVTLVGRDERDAVGSTWCIGRTPDVGVRRKVAAWLHR